MKSFIDNALRLCAIILLAATGCSSGKMEITELEGIRQNELKEKINTNSQRIKTFQGEGSISFESPQESNSGSMEIRLKRPDSLFVKIEGPFGISIASAMITRNEFIYYNAQENKAITGPTTELNIGAILRIRMGFDELLDCVTASFSFPVSEADTAEAGIAGNYYRLPIGGAEFLIEPYTYNILELKRAGLEVGYSKFTNISSVLVPSEILVEMPNQRQTVRLNYDSMEINKKDLSFKIKVPKSARIVKWE
jgi:outer membrane lipoprotein-sorting protein